MRRLKQASLDGKSSHPDTVFCWNSLTLQAAESTLIAPWNWGIFRTKDSQKKASQCQRGKHAPKAMPFCSCGCLKYVLFLPRALQKWLNLMEYLSTGLKPPTTFGPPKPWKNEGFRRSKYVSKTPNYEGIVGFPWHWFTLNAEPYRRRSPSLMMQLGTQKWWLLMWKKSGRSPVDMVVYPIVYRVFQIPPNQLIIWRMCHYLQGFIHVRWLFGISEPSTVGIEGFWNLEDLPKFKLVNLPPM